MHALALVCAIALGGERVSLDADFRPLFSDRQVQNTAQATRDGFAKWAVTDQGRRILQYFNSREFDIQVIESSDEDGLGRAPQPGLATLVAAGDHKKRKYFQVILNPAYFKMPADMAPLPNQPASPADVMAIAWAGEMLHVYFYAQGISLPHHPRDDFQELWQEVAAQLGMPAVRHDDADEMRHTAIVRFLGRGR